jgi:DNA-binding GntR family transcriptional regulator
MPSDTGETAQFGLTEGAPRTLTSAVFNEIRADILSTRLLPGQKLHIGALAERFSVSLGAIREALSRLVTNGLVEAADQRGFRVHPVSLEDLQDVMLSRIEIEGLALKYSIERGDNAWADDLQYAHERLVAEPHRDAADPMRHNPAWAMRHKLFHEALVSACPLHWLIRFRNTLFEQSERYRCLSVPLSPVNRDVAAEHRLIFEAALCRDVPSALASLSDHFSRTMTIVLEGAPLLQAGDKTNWPSP